MIPQARYVQNESAQDPEILEIITSDNPEHIH